MNNDKTHWQDQTECQDCGVAKQDASLRAIKMQSGYRDLLCRDCFQSALDDNRVHPTDPRLTNPDY